MAVIVRREISISVAIKADSMAAANEAFEQIQQQVNNIGRRHFFVVRRRGSYTERAYVIHDEE